MELNEIDQSLKTGELTLTAQEESDLDEAYDQLIIRQQLAVDKHPREQDEATKLERYQDNQTLIVEGTFEVTLRFIHDTIRALEEKIYRMELLGQHQDESDKFDRMHVLLTEAEGFLDDFVPAVSDKVALRRQVAGK